MESAKSNSIADHKYLDLLSNVNFNPTFIMGDHRSGTTLLYKTLVKTGCFNFVRAYHIIKYDEILSNHINQTENKAIRELEELFETSGISDRKIDKVIANPDLPEEYGFILKNVAKDESYITPKNLSIFQQLCRKVQFASDLDRPLLLKNPWDFKQFMYVKRVFPTAKFIFIHRHPVHVINSKLKAMRSLLSSWNSYVALIAQGYTQIFQKPLLRYFLQLLYSKYFDLGLHRVTKQSAESTTYFLKNEKLLSDDDYLSIKYEDLCQTPEVTIDKIMKFLRLESKLALNYDSLIESRSLKLLPEVTRKQAEICHKLQSYLAYHHYDALS